MKSIQFIKHADQYIAGFFEANLTRLIVAITPYTASFPPAAFLYVNLIAIMQLDPLTAFIIAVAVEGIGVASVSTFFKAKRHNLHYSAAKNQVDEWPAKFAYAVYLTAVIATNVILEIGTASLAEILAKAALSLMALSGALIISVNFAITSVRTKNSTSQSEKEKQLQIKLADTKAEFADLQKEYRKMQAEFVKAQTQFADLQAATQAMQTDAQALQALNPVAQAAARYVAGQFATQQAAAEVVQVDASTISRLAKSLNGNKS